MAHGTVCSRHSTSGASPVARKSLPRRWRGGPAATHSRRPARYRWRRSWHVRPYSPSGLCRCLDVAGLSSVVAAVFLLWQHAIAGTVPLHRMVDEVSDHDRLSRGGGLELRGGLSAHPDVADAAGVGLRRRDGFVSAAGHAPYGVWRGVDVSQGRRWGRGKIFPVLSGAVITQWLFNVDGSKQLITFVNYGCILTMITAGIVLMSKYVMHHHVVSVKTTVELGLLAACGLIYLIGARVRQRDHVDDVLARVRSRARPPAGASARPRSIPSATASHRESRASRQRRAAVEASAHVAGSSPQSRATIRRQAGPWCASSCSMCRSR